MYKGLNKTTKTRTRNDLIDIFIDENKTLSQTCIEILKGKQ